MSEFWLDGDGYPTEELLEAIKNWPYEDARACLDLVRSAWNWDDWATVEEVQDEVFPDRKVTQYRFATGGWSGNESLLSALSQNLMIYSLYWYMSKRGGLVVYRYYPLKP